jgi:hypothetical protein
MSRSKVLIGKDERTPKIDKTANNWPSIRIISSNPVLLDISLVEYAEHLQRIFVDQCSIGDKHE